ncbi:AcrID1 family anti-CRISPR protein, partial [Brevibacterium marinum]
LSNKVVKLIIHYFKEDGFINILEIDLFREKR